MAGSPSKLPKASLAQLTMPMRFTRKSGAYSTRRSCRAGPSRSWSSSWLLAAPQTILALIPGMVSGLRMPPTALGARMSAGSARMALSPMGTTRASRGASGFMARVSSMASALTSVPTMRPTPRSTRSRTM